MSKSISRRMQTFGITQQTYLQMREAQQERCAICGVTDRNADKALGIDHSHETGDLRGLLCSKCNSGLGFFNDNISILLAALKYLRYWKAPRRPLEGP